MPTLPHPVTFTVYQKDNTTLSTTAKVYVRNVTKKSTSSEETVNSSGIAIISLANLPITPGQTVPYETGDVVLLIAYDTASGTHDAAAYTVTGSSKSQTLYLNPIPLEKNAASQRLMMILGGNTGGTVYYFKAYDIDTGQLITHVEVPANDTRPALFGWRGRRCSGGFVVERENNALLVTAHTE